MAQHFKSMPSDTLSLFSDVPLDTPPLSPSRSHSSASATRSSVASSNSSISLGEFAFRMSKTRFDHPTSPESTESVDAYLTTSRKFAHDNVMFTGQRERDIAEEIDADMEQVGEEGRGRSGYDGRFAHRQAVASSTPTRPSIPRQGSYSKRHSSFDTPREVPFPRGYLSSSENPLPVEAVPSGELPHERSDSAPAAPQQSGDQSESHPGTEAESALNKSTSRITNDSPPLPHGRSSISLPLPTSMPYSSLPPLGSSGSPPRFENPRPVPMMPKSMTPLESGAQFLVASPPRTSFLEPSMTRTETSFPYPSSRFPGQSPSPPLLVDENDTNEPNTAQSAHIHPAYDLRTHYSLPPPPPQKNPSLASTSSSSSRPTSLPHALSNRAFSSTSRAGSHTFPPPQPPTILTPPLPLSADEEGVRKRAPYEPFLPRDQPPADHTYIAVETVPSEYRLLVRLPGFQRESITLVTRRRRILHIVADNWSDGGGHFERRISFGYDADLGSVRAEFDGEILRIVIPRRVLPTLYAQVTA